MPRAPLPEKTSDIHILAKPSGAICNLDCAYCFYLEKQRFYPKESGGVRMADDVLERYTRDFIAAQAGANVTFAWQGGEPTLLGVDFFRRAVSLQKQYAAGRTITNTLQTNGILLDDAWGDFLAQEKFLIGVSIDGPGELHDAFRVGKGGQPTFERVMKGIRLLQAHAVEFNTLTCVHHRNSGAPLEVYRFLKEIGSGFMQFIPIAERRRVRASGPHELVPPAFTGRARVAEWSVEPEQYGSFLTTIFDEWVRHDVGRVFVQLFDVSLEIWAGLAPSLCVFREECGDALALEHNGDLYSCDHFVYPESRLGNIVEEGIAALAHSPRQRRFGAAKRKALPRYCQQCDVRFACNGECPKHRFARTPDGEAGLNYLCRGYKRFFHHVAPYMTFMAEQLKRGQAPAEVMAMANAQDKAAERQ